MSTIDWLPAGLHPVALRLARADGLAYELAQVALNWSRGTNGDGALTVRQVERDEGYYNVEVASIRPVPPIAAMLFSEAIGHLRASLDNVVFHLAEQEHGQPLTDSQERAISMLIYDNQASYDKKLKSLRSQGLNVFEPTATLGKRIAAVQPFNESAAVPSLSPTLAALMRVPVVNANPLSLLREYSNHDKHRSMRLAAGQALVQNHRDWDRSVAGGMRAIEVGTVLAKVKKGVYTEVDLSASLMLERPDGTWVAFGPEIDGISTYIADVAIPILVTGLALPDSLPVTIDLTDNGRSIAERAEEAGSVRAHERARVIMMQALVEAEHQDIKWPETVNKAQDPTG
ncbi:hypothetical protein ACIO3S_08280 [Nocardioides sp. NPDC087217]|uniref:hypothetical protein n=1 Tax=Nocardioides sp. NPDC087217 TaxID=3364335 RepID=UPI0038149AD6